MRYQTEFNYMLKIREWQWLPSEPEVGKAYQFSKTIERIYPIGLPIFLTDDDLRVIGKCVVTEYTVWDGNTSWSYTIISIYDEEISRVMTDDMLASFAYVKDA